MSYMPKSKTDHYETPERVYSEMIDAFGIHIEDCFDPCPLNSDFDGLLIHWDFLNFVNPPYSLLKDFVEKSLEEAKRAQCRSILLLPAKTDQAWFHTIKHLKIHWFKGRIKFKNQKDHATQPHFLVLVK